MSANKMKYFEVTTTSIVQALNKGDAHDVSRGTRRVSGNLIEQTEEITQITATEAKANQSVNV